MIRQKPPRQSKYQEDPYPWLDEKDPRTHMTDKQILEIKYTCLKPVSQKGNPR